MRILHPMKQLLILGIISLTLIPQPIAAQNAKLSSSYYREASIAERNGNFAQAINKYSQAFTINSEDYMPLMKMALIYMSHEVDLANETEALQRAVQYLSKAIKINKADPAISLKLAEAYNRLEMYDLAEQQFNRAINLDPSNSLLNYNLGLFYFERKDFKKSILLLNKLIIAYPEHLRARGYLAASLQSTDSYYAAIEQYNYIIKYKPNDYGIYKNLGDSLFAVGKFQESLAAYLKAKSIDPHVPDIHAAIGNVSARLKDYTKSIENYKRAIQLKNTKSWHKSLAKAFWHNHDLEEAADAFMYVEDYDVAAFIQQKLGNHQNAIDSYHLALKEKPNDTKSMFNLARIYLELGELEKSKDLYQSILEFKPDDQEVEFLLGIVEQELGSVDAAISHYQDIIDNSGKTQKDLKRAVLYNLGLGYQSKNNNEKAKEYFMKIINSDLIIGFNKAEDVYLALNNILLDTNRLDLAVKYLDKAIAGEPSNADYHFAKADLLFRGGHSKQAVTVMRLAAALDKSIEGQLKLAKILFENEQIYEALDNYQGILETKPKNVPALLGTANCFQALELKDEARNAYKLALEIKPDDYLINYNYGLLLQNQKQYQSAIEYYKKALDSNPEYIDLYYVLGFTYWNMDDKDQARSYFDKFLVHSSDERMKKNIRELLQSSADIGSSPNSGANQNDVDLSPLDDDFFQVDYEEEQSKIQNPYIESDLV